MIITLSDDLIAKISAGEVIERPASCVKELIENSIDASATKISCKVKANGVPFISISDNGIGMTEKEIKLALLPHTTSKIKNEEDLMRINTLGFRGEALPSIKKVSELEVLTKARGEEQGVYLRTKGDEISEIRPAARVEGTTITVRNLFFNVPVRRKFLKSTFTEFRNITNIVERLAIAHPEIAFSLFHNDENIFELETCLPVGTEGNLKERLIQLFGEAFETLVPFGSVGACPPHLSGINPDATGKIKIRGYTSRPDNLLVTGYKEFIFVNKRPVKYNLIRKAIREGYGTVMKERFPSFVIFIDTQSDFIDANIHPRKEEVRFQNESLIYGEVLKAVRESLGMSLFEYERVGREVEFGAQLEKFWQFKETYIFASAQDGVVIIDQHAAHERIIYEKLLNIQVESQTLLFPLLITLTLTEYKIFEQYREIFKDLGFEIDDFGEKDIKIQSVPSTLKDFTEKTFKEMIFEVAESGKIKGDRLKEVSKIIACKSATKKGNKLKEQEMQTLINQLFSCSEPYFCPHGRPTMIRITEQELTRRFER